jgi:hypothetical protein
MLNIAGMAGDAESTPRDDDHAAAASCSLLWLLPFETARPETTAARAPLSIMRAPDASTTHVR